MTHKLAVVTVIYGNYSILKDFFDSFEKQTDKNFEIFVVDFTEKRETFKYPKFATILEGQNRGYAYGLNLGLKKAISSGLDKFVCINSDTYVDKHFVENVSNSLNNHKSSIIGGKIYYASGYEYHKDRCTKSNLGKVIWYAGGAIDWNNIDGCHRGVDEIDRGQFDNLEETDFVTGCLVCLDKEVIDKIGFFDESYFLYFEDADYCQRAKKVGIKQYYDPSLVIWHKNAQSTGGAGSLIHQKYQEKNRLKFALKYAPIRTKLHLLKNLVKKTTISKT